MNVNWNVKGTFFTLYFVNGMAAFDRIKLLCLKKNTFHSFKVSSSPKSPLLFAIVFWGETNRTSLSHMFFKTDIRKNFANFTGKH